VFSGAGMKIFTAALMRNVKNNLTGQGKGCLKK
jgi:hypothetical protein